MKVAIVTGGSSGIGLEIAKVLIELDYLVYALGRDFSKTDFENKNFIKRECDLKNRKEITLFWELIKRQRVDILINSAGVGYFGLYENLSLDEIDEMIEVNLKAPLFLTKLFIKNLKVTKGYIININSISAIKPAIYGCVYGATKAGLRHFGKSLWAESRKSGIKVVNIEPDITKTNWFDDKNFTYYNDKEYYIDPKDIANLIKNIIKSNLTITDIVIEPQKFRVEKK